MRGLLEMPIKLEKQEGEGDLYLTFGVWVLTETAEFFRIMEKWKEPEIFTVNGHLNNFIPSFDDTLGIPVTLTTRLGGLRPIIGLKDTAASPSPLLLAIQNGITLSQVETLYESLFHSKD